MGRGKDGTFLGSQGGEQWGHGEEHTPADHDFPGLLWASIFLSVSVEKAGCSGVSSGIIKKKK